MKARLLLLVAVAAVLARDATDDELMSVASALCEEKPMLCEAIYNLYKAQDTAVVDATADKRASFVRLGKRAPFVRLGRSDYDKRAPFVRLGKREYEEDITEDKRAAFVRLGKRAPFVRLG